MVALAGREAASRPGGRGLERLEAPLAARLALGDVLERALEARAAGARLGVVGEVLLDQLREEGTRWAVARLLLSAPYTSCSQHGIWMAAAGARACTSEFM